MFRFIQILGLFCLQLITLLDAKSIENIVALKKTDDKKPFTLADVVSKNFTSDVFNGTWISETEFYYTVDKEIFTFDVTTLKTESFAKLNNLDLIGYYKMTISPDKNFILIHNDTQSLYRHGSLSYISIFNIKEKSLRNLHSERVSLALWTPIGSNLIYVLENDIYYYDTKYNEHRRLTKNEDHQTIYNGISDWVYEEEVFADCIALWISPNGEHLAFATFNDSNVREASFPKYGNPDKLDNQYPEDVKIRYPKPGTPNPKVTLNLIDLSDHGSSAIPLFVPIEVVGTEPILYAVSWLDSKTVAATWTNRVQNQSQIVGYSLDGNFHYLLSRNEPHGWLLNSNVPPLYYNNNFLLLQPQTTDNKTLGTFSHLTRYRLLNNVLSDEVDLTPGRMWVTSILGVSDLKRAVYFTASPHDKPTEMHLYEVSLANLENSAPKPVCVSCDIVTLEGNKCTYIGGVSFSKNYSNYVITCAGPDVPITSFYDFNHSKLRDWSLNEKTRENFGKRAAPIVRNLTVNSDGYDLNVRLYLPPDFDAAKKYPLLLNVYGGPESQMIKDNFQVGFPTFMTTYRHVIYAKVDGRGSNSRGTSIMYEVYRDLGNKEMVDQINAVRILQKMFKWIDGNKIGVWGWSYGGYATAMILATDIDEIFKCGISVAPVTNWMLYDSIYTERYMGLPTENDNIDKYQSSSIMSRVREFKKKKFMLIHGTGDDNVHFQQSMMLSKQLAKEDVIFEQITYPDEAHSLAHVTTHLYHNMDVFWSKCFGYDATDNGGLQSNNTASSSG